MIKFSSLIKESSGSKFKLGLDIHGVVDAMPEFFSFLSDSFIKNGGEVHIITGGKWDKEFEDLLNSYGVKWTHKFSIYDYLVENNYEKTGEVQFPDGTIQSKFKNEDWDSVKGVYCADNNITLHIDDTMIYNDYFKTPFARLWSHNNKPKAPSKDVRHFK
jgi:hypothetical protein